jgi:hypothetical protein
VNKPPEVILERLLVRLLTRKKVTLCKFWTLETLKVGENPLLQIVPSMNYTGTQKRIPQRCRLVGSDDEGFHQYEIVTAS